MNTSPEFIRTISGYRLALGPAAIEFTPNEAHKVMLDILAMCDATVSEELLGFLQANSK